MPYEFRDESPCTVCERVAGTGQWAEVVRSSSSVAFVPSRQPTHGTTLVVPVRHVLAPSDLPDDEAEDLWFLLRRMVGATMAVFQPASYHVSQYVGMITGEPLEHLWWRLEPRYERPPSLETDVTALPPVPVDERYRQADRLREQLPPEDA